MARSRNIKPGFFTNADLIECQPLARILFAGLWCEADPRGVVEDRPTTLKIKLLPGDDCNVDALLDELVAHGFIVRYQKDGKKCLWVRSFSAHQNPHFKEKPNSLPIPDEHPDNPVQAPDKTETKPRRARVKTEASRDDSLNRIPDSTIPQPDSLSTGDTPEGGGVTNIPNETTLEQRFDIFWSAYPRPVGKKPAWERWQKLKPDDALLAVMLAAVAEQRKMHQWRKENGNYIPHPTTWLTKASWTDVVTPESLMDTPTGPVANTSVESSLDDYRRKRALRQQGQTVDEPHVIDIEGVVR